MNYVSSLPTRVPVWIYLLVLVAGAISVFAFSPFDFYPIAWLTPAVLFFALTKADTKKQFVTLGWLFGLGLFGAGASWPFYSLFFFAKAHIVVAVLGTASFVAFVALFSTGLFGLIAYFFKQYSIFLRLLFIYPAIWVLVEWVRTWLFTGFPWLFLGNSQIDTWLVSIAPITGVLGVSFFCAIISGALLCCYYGNSIHKTVFIKADPDSQMVSNQAIVEEKFGPSVRLISSIIILFIVASSVLLKQFTWTKAIGKPLTVSVLQSNIAQEVKLDPSSLLPTLDLYQEMTKQSKDSDLIVWPETALFDSFDRHMDSIILPLQNSLKDSKKSILMGGFFLNDKQGVENSVLAINATHRSLYSKKHLVPFGEYTPLLSYLRWLGKWIQLPYDNVSAGTGSGTLKVNDYTAQMTICYEDAFGEEMIEQLPESHFLINVTHDGWFSGSLEPYQHMQIARMRSIEMGRYMVRSTTNGPAGIIDDKGQVVATAPAYTRSIITSQIRAMTGSTPYVIWGNWLIVGVLSLMLFIALLIKRKSENGFDC